MPGAEKVALIGYGLWQRDFGATPDIVGKAVRINGTPATIVGVMPQGFAFPQNEQLWIPLFSEFPVRPRNDPRNVNPSIVALLRSDVSLDQANAEVATFARHVAETYPETSQQFNQGQVEPLLETYTPIPLRGTLLTMLAFCVGVLLIGCVNVMNMQFARATLRSRELAIRSSLGAGRWRIVRQLLTESVIVALLGAVGGILLAFWGADLIWLGIPPESNTPYYIRWSVDGWTMLYTVVVSVVVGILFGLAPALEATRGSIQASLKEGGRGGVSAHRHRLRSGLVVAEVALSLILLVGASLFVRSFVNAYNSSAGFDTAPLMTLRFAMPNERYPGPSPKARRCSWNPWPVCPISPSGTRPISTSPCKARPSSPPPARRM